MQGNPPSPFFRHEATMQDHKAAFEMAIFDAAPAELRDFLNYAPRGMPAQIGMALYRRGGVAQVELAQIDKLGGPLPQPLLGQRRRRVRM
jgi:hypothetical protein